MTAPERMAAVRKLHDYLPASTYKSSKLDDLTAEGGIAMVYDVFCFRDTRLQKEDMDG